MNDKISRIARRVTVLLGSPWACVFSVLLMLAWIAWGFVRHYDAFSQLALNTVTSIISFVLLFLVLHAQNKDSLATSLKLDEVIRADENADNEFRHLEAADEARLREIEAAVERDTDAR